MPRSSRRPSTSPARKRPPSPPPVTVADSEENHADTEEAVLKIVEDSLGQMHGDETDGNRLRTRLLLKRQQLKPFLTEVRRRVREELRELRQRRITEPRQRVGNRARVVRDNIAKKIRQKITGEEDLRVRDYVRGKMSILEEPPVVRLRDKMSFLGGVTGVLVVEAVCTLRPQQFWICYVC